MSRPSSRLFIAAAFVSLFAGFAAPATHAAVVTVREPAFDFPHVCADNDIDAARQEGYEAAKDRIAQFLLIMGTARGTLHQAIGNLANFEAGDAQTRRETYSRSEFNLMYDTLSPDEQAIVLAYAEGVNSAIGDMLKTTPVIPQPLELKFFKQSSVAGKDNLFGNKDVLTQGEGLDPFYQGLGAPGFEAGGFQFTPELSMAFATLQIRNFGFEAWDEVAMAEDLSKLITTYGATTGTELWDDRHWINDPLAPVSVPDPRNPGFGGPLSDLSIQERIEVAEAVGRIQDRVRGRTRLPGYPMRDYAKALAPWRKAAADRERMAKEWGAWPKLGSYAWTIAPSRSATGNPWVGGFPQTGIQVPSLMHYTEIRGDTIQGSGMTFTGGPYVLIGHTDNVAFTTTTAHMKLVDSYIEELANGDFDLFEYDNHGVQQAMAKRVELVHRPVGPALEVAVFRTNVVCSVNGCTNGSRIVSAFSGDAAGVVSGATGSSVTDSAATLVAAAYAGGHLAIVDGKGAGQMREIASNTTDTFTTVNPFTTTPDTTSEYVAVLPANVVTAVASESAVWLGEGTAAAGFSLYQKAQSVLDIRNGVRKIPSTHNFAAADNSAYNGIGTDAGTGNIYYGTSGFKRVRQGALDPRLPLDGTVANPFNIVSGVVDSAAIQSLTATGDFVGQALSSAAINYVYDNPDDNGAEYIVAITAGDGYAQTRRITSNTDDTLTLEHAWGQTPSAGDTYAVYEIWATPEALNPAEGFTANWNNKQARANDIMLSQNGRNHRVESILEQLSLNASVDRAALRDLNKYVAGVSDPGTPGRYLLSRVTEAIAAHGDCGTVDDELVTQNADPERGREFVNPLIVEPAGTAVAASAASGAPDYIRGWATELADDIYGDEYDAAGVGKLTGSRAIGWALHAIDAAAADVAGSYTNAYAGDYFNGSDWKLVVRDSFCDYVAANPTVEPKDRPMRNYNHPLAALPCQQGCSTPIEFDPTPLGNRGTWEQIVEVGTEMVGEFMFPLGQSGFIDGSAAGFTASGVKQGYHASSMQPLWRDWRFAPMLHVCEDITHGVDEDGDTDGDGVVDGFEKFYYAGSIANDGVSDTDLDGASLATEYRWGSDPTLDDTDEDGVVDGNDVAPQDRLCVKGRLKKLSAKDSSKAGKDKVSAKWEAPLNVCVGGDYQTACTTDADCAPVGSCRRLNMNPVLDSIRIVAADDTPLLDADIPVSKTLWKNSKDTKFSYKDTDAVNGPVAKISIKMNEKKNVVQLSFKTKGLDMSAAPDAAAGVVGISIGTRCFMETSANCKQKDGKLSCKADAS